MAKKGSYAVKPWDKKSNILIFHQHILSISYQLQSFFVCFYLIFDEFYQVLKRWSKFGGKGSPKFFNFETFLLI